MGVGWEAIADGSGRLRPLRSTLAWLTVICVAAAAVTASLASPALAGSGAGATGASGGGLHVIPFPGTPDASTQSQIIFSSLSPSDIRAVDVSGSRSGRHSGHVGRLPAGAGSAFVPDRQFAPGERVSVVAQLASASAGTASGDPGSTVLRFSFTTGVPVAVGSAASMHSPRAGVANVPTLHIRSQVDFHPPAVTVGPNPDGASGEIFLAPKDGGIQSGPMIINRQGRLVWFYPARGAANNLEMQTYRGRPVLTWWHGSVPGQHPEDIIMDNSYRTIAKVHAGAGYSADSHEFQITRQGTALIDAVTTVRSNLTSVGGSRHGKVHDPVIQEIDVKTGRVLWEWHALGHVPVRYSYRGKPSGSGAYDYLHLNSVQQLPDGDLLVSGRNTWAVYLISKRTGNVLWTLGGKHSSFRMGRGTKFEWQHDARMTGQTLTLFNDAWDAVPSHQEEWESSAKSLAVNTSARTVTLRRRYSHNPPLLSASQGSAQMLPNHNIFVGWGAAPEFSEYTPNGHQIFTGSLPLGVDSYRAYRFRWAAQPLKPPSLAVSPQPGGAVKVYASWNGATRVTRWRVLGGSSPSRRRWFDAKRWTGFETVMTLHSQPRYFEVQALDRHGHVLGTSTPHQVRSHVSVFGSEAFVSTSSGYGGVAVGCFTHQRCTIGLKVSAGRSVLAQTSGVPVGPRTGAMLYFRLSAAGRRKLARARHHRLSVKISARDASGAATSTGLTLVPYSTSGSGPARSLTQSHGVQIVGNTQFASADGRGGILAACYEDLPCHVKATISAGGTVIASTSAHHLGVNELGSVEFRLTPTGRAMLAHAHGNQLAAQVTLTSGGNTASGRIALVRHG